MRPNEYQSLAEKVFALYDEAELRIMEKLAKQLADGIDGDSGLWRTRKLSEISHIKRALRRQLTQLSQDSKTTLKEALMQAYGYGSQQFINELLKTPFEGELVRPSLRRVFRILNNTQNRLLSVNQSIFRKSIDSYRDIVEHATAMVSTGSITIRQAVKMELEAFANAGLRSFIDKSGREWSLSNYAEMATITALNRATLNAYIDQMDEYGFELAYVSSHGDSCPLCRNWEGEIVSVHGKDPNYPSLDDAIASGLYHPNCKHDISTYYEGISKPVKQPTVEPPDYGGSPNPRAQQRYYESQVRKWKRRMVTAIDPKAESQAFDKVQLYRGQIRNLVDKHDLPRKYYKEGGAVKLSDGAAKYRLSKARNLAKINTQNLLTRYPNAKHIKDKTELLTYFEEKYGIPLDKELQSLHSKSLKNTLLGIEKVLEDFPTLKTAISKIQTDQAIQGLASTTFTGEINLNGKFYKEANVLNEEIKRLLASHYSPANAGIREVGIHEMGHVVERHFLLKDGITRNEAVQKWNESYYSKTIVKSAAQRLNLSKEALKNARAEISDYAVENYSETLAEALTDYYRNGENAQSLSKEIFQVLKEELK